MKTIYVGSIICCALLIAFTKVTAVVAMESWSVIRSSPTSFDIPAWCPQARLAGEVNGFSRPQELCDFGGKYLKVASFLADGLEPRIAVSTLFDSVRRPVEGVCRGVLGCIYSPERDLLVVRYRSDQFHYGIMIFQALVSRLKLTSDGQSYTFDMNNPTYQSSNFFVGATALSQNGNWLAVENVDRGISVINLTTFEHKLILKTGVRYGQGMDPRYELAVSNDGRHIAVMGLKSGFSIIDSALCKPDPEDCMRVEGDTTRFIPSFYFAAHPRFDTTGRQLSFYAASFGQGSRWVIMRQPGYVPQPLSYLAMGDSFSSGEGETDDRMYRKGTNELDERCHLSARSYPFLIGARLGISDDMTQSVACAGAKTSDLIGKDASYTGQGMRLGQNREHLLTEEERSVAQNEALENFFPGRIYQMRFVEQYQPAVVTIGIGGNDAGFIAKLKTCAMPNLCEWAEDPGMRHQTGLEIQRLFKTYQELFSELKERSPKSVVYAIGYPQIINPEGNCGALVTTLLTFAERVFMEQSIQYLNKVMASAAESVGIFYIDIEQSFKDRELCSITPFPKAVNGLRLGDDMALTSHLPILKIIGNETFHPTPVGHALVTKSILEKYGDIRQTQQCEHCSSLLTAPPLPSYWIQEADRQITRRQYYQEIASSERVSPSDNGISVELPPGSLEPGTFAQLELHSEQRLLDEVKVAPDGSLYTKVTIPSDTSEGFHTLHIYAITYDHTLVDIYDVLSYSETNVTNSVASYQSLDFSHASPSVLGVTSRYPLNKSSKESLHQNDKIFLSGLAIGVACVITTITLVWLVVRQRMRNASRDRGG